MAWTTVSEESVCCNGSGTSFFKTSHNLLHRHHLLPFRSPPATNPSRRRLRHHHHHHNRLQPNVATHHRRCHLLFRHRIRKLLMVVLRRFGVMLAQL